MQKVKTWVDRITPVILLLYFVIGLMAYVTVWPGSTAFFKSNALTGILTRAVITFLLIFHAGFYCFLHKESGRFPWKWAIVFLLVLIVNLLVCCFGGRTQHFFYKNVYGILFEVTSTVGYRQILTMYLSSVSDFALGFCFLFLLPASIRKSSLIPLAVFVLLFMAFECGYSAIHDREQIIALFNKISDPYSGYDVSIGASFGDKQEFGTFLTIGLCCAIVMPLLLPKRRGPLFTSVIITCAILGLIFLIFCFFSLCKTAMVASSLLVIGVALFGVVRAIKKNRALGIALISVFATVALGIVLFLSVPAFHESGILAKVYTFLNNYFLSKINSGIFSRFYLVGDFFSKMSFVHFLFGWGKGLQSNYMAAASGNSAGLHTGVVFFQACYGLVGSMLYAFCTCLVVRSIIRTLKADYYLGAVLVGILICSFVFNVSENHILIISGSATVFVYNLLCVSLARGVERSEAY